MVRLAEELYVAKNIDNLGTIVYSLRRDIPVFRLYCLVVRPERGRLEILSSKHLFGAHDAKQDGWIVGVALGYHEAVDLLCFIAAEAVAQGMDPCHPIRWFDTKVDLEKEGTESAESQQEEFS